MYHEDKQSILPDPRWFIPAVLIFCCVFYPIACQMAADANRFQNMEQDAPDAEGQTIH